MASLRDTLKGAVSKLKSGGQTAVQHIPEVADMSGEILGAGTDLGGNVNDALGGTMSVGSAVLGAAGTTVAAVQTGKDLFNAGSQLKDMHDFKKAAKKDPEVRSMLAERENHNMVLIVHQNEMAKRAEQVAALGQQAEVYHNALDENHPSHAGLTAADLEIAQQELDRLTQKAEGLLESIHGLKAATAGVDARITEINQDPRIQQLTALEAKADLAKDSLKHSGSSVRNAMDTAQKGLSTMSDSAQAVLNVVQLASIGGSAVGTASAIAGPAISIATGSLQAGVSAVNLGMDVHAFMKHAKLQNKAADAREGISDEALESAIKRVELQAKYNKVVKGAEGLRNGALVVTGVATGAAGAAALTAAVGSAAMGFGAIPGAVAAGVSVGVGVGSGAVAVGSTVGVMAFKKGVNMYNDSIADEARTALEGLNKLRSAVLNNQNVPEGGGPIITEKEQAAIIKLRQHAVEKGQISLEKAGDLDALCKYTEKRVISRDNKEAATVLAGKLLAETREARNHRQGGSLVAADLPQNGEAINALRKIGLKDRDILNISNAIANKGSNEVGMKTLMQKTGLKA